MFFYRVIRSILKCFSEELKTTLSRLLSANEVLTGEASFEHLIDEHASSIFVRWER